MAAVNSFVFLNTKKSAEHGRFDAAHELGHLVLHRHGSPQGREAEQEANAFASAFLMPRASLLAQAPHIPTLEHLIKLKKIWSVSVAALTYRLHTVGAISDWHYQTLFVELVTRLPKERARRGAARNIADSAEGIRGASRRRDLESTHSS